MKNSSNKMLYVNDNSEEIVIPLSRFTTASVASDTVVNLYFDSHVEGQVGDSAYSNVAVTTTSDAEDVLKSILGAFASSRDSVLDLTQIHSKISSVEVTYGTAVGLEGKGGQLSATYGAGLLGTSSFAGPNTYQTSANGIIKTTYEIDLTGLGSKSDEGDVKGLVAGGAAYLDRIVTATHGLIFKAEMSILELPAASSNPGLDIDLRSNSSDSAAYDTDGSGYTAVITMGGDAVAGATYVGAAGQPANNDYLYLITGATHTGDSVYTGGQLIITLWGRALLS